MAASTSAPSPPRSCSVELANDPAVLEAHFAVCRRIFVAAQGLFLTDDRDARDDAAATLHAVGCFGEHVCGAVRLYPLDDDGLWKGDRLAVLPSERVQRLGAMLVAFAVRTAGARGGHTMHASIQRPNVEFFERLGWTRAGRIEVLHGLEHQPMATALDAGDALEAQPGGVDLSRRPAR